MRFGDPTFEYGVALSKVAGHIVLRSADANVLPMRFGDFSSTLDRYVDELHKLVDKTRKDTDEQHQLLDAHAFTLDADPTHPVAPPERDSDVPAIDLAPLDQAAKQLKQSAQAFETAYGKRAATGFNMPAQQVLELNAADGSHGAGIDRSRRLANTTMVQAHDLCARHADRLRRQDLPGVREALEARRWAEANHYAVITAKVIDHYRRQLDQLTVLLDTRS
jgi:N-acetylated-alpha-linked acidic dipeptidase